MSLLRVLFLGFLMAGSINVAAQDRSPLFCKPAAGDTTLPKGGVNPWPWGSELTFPWTGIEGTWREQGTSCGSLYSFSILKDSKGARIVSVYEYDPHQCKVISAGRGVEQKKVVRAFMTGSTGPYQLTIHAFRHSDLNSKKGTDVYLVPDPVMVMRKRQLRTDGRPSSKSYAFQLERVDKSPDMVCK